DQGIGIDRRALSQIFERYRQAPEIDQQRVASAGLGLRFVKLVVARHRGSIDVQSVPGEGSCFRLRFPLAPEPVQVSQCEPPPATTHCYQLPATSYQLPATTHCYKMP